MHETKGAEHNKPQGRCNDAQPQCSPPTTRLVHKFLATQLAQNVGSHGSAEHGGDGAWRRAGRVRSRRTHIHAHKHERTSTQRHAQDAHDHGQPHGHHHDSPSTGKTPVRKLSTAPNSCGESMWPCERWVSFATAFSEEYTTCQRDTQSRNNNLVEKPHVMKKKRRSAARWRLHLAVFAFRTGMLCTSCPSGRGGMLSASFRSKNRILRAKGSSAQCNKWLQVSTQTYMTQAQPLGQHHTVVLIASWMSAMWMRVGSTFAPALHADRKGSFRRRHSMINAFFVSASSMQSSTNEGLPASSSSAASRVNITGRWSILQRGAKFATCRAAAATFDVPTSARWAKAWRLREDTVTWSKSMRRMCSTPDRASMCAAWLPVEVTRHGSATTAQSYRCATMHQPLEALQSNIATYLHLQHQPR